MSRFWLLLLVFFVGNVVVHGKNTTNGVGLLVGRVHVDGTKTLGFVNDNFVCATIDWWPPTKCDNGTCSWGLASVLNLDLSSHVLLNAVKAFSPLLLRIGGTLQDIVLYETKDRKTPCTGIVKNSSGLYGFNEGCLSMARWDELNDFIDKSGAAAFFGLNALNGRFLLPDGSSFGGPWDYKNAESFIRYTFSKGYKIEGWEYGNELSGVGIEARVGVKQYAHDIMKLRSIIDEIYNSSLHKPLILAPGGLLFNNDPNDTAWYKEFVHRTKPDSLDVVTHHIYNLLQGTESTLISRILNATYLDGVAQTFRDLQHLLHSSKTSATAWISEAGGVYNSGRDRVSNVFVNSFWYLDQLGLASSYDTKAYCRQTLIGGNYGLLNTTTYVPNPDYYSALLWHRLMGRKVLSTKFAETKNTRAYAHCARQSKGITLVLLNLDGNTTTQVTPAIRFGATKELKEQQAKVGVGREEYHLTPKDGNLQSRTVLLNGKILSIDQNGRIPPLPPVLVEASKPIIVKPHSIVFAHIPYYTVPICE